MFVKEISARSLKFQSSSVCKANRDSGVLIYNNLLWQCTGREMTMIRMKHGEFCDSFSMSPSGKRIVLAFNKYASDGSVIWFLQAYDSTEFPVKLIVEIMVSYSIDHVACSEDKIFVASVGSNIMTILLVLNMTTVENQTDKSILLGRRVTSMALVGDHLWICGYQSIAILHSSSLQPHEVLTFPRHTSELICCAFGPFAVVARAERRRTGGWLFIHTYDQHGTMCYTTKSGHMRHTFEEHVPRLGMCITNSHNLFVATDETLVAFRLFRATHLICTGLMPSSGRLSSIRSAFSRSTIREPKVLGLVSRLAGVPRTPKWPKLPFFQDTDEFFLGTHTRTYKFFLGVLCAFALVWFCTLNSHFYLFAS